MKNSILTIGLFLVTTFAFAQTQFEQGMGKALQLWKEGKNNEATALFERIAGAEKNSWLPNYYIGLINATAAFQTKEKTELGALLAKANQAIDTELAKTPNNPELLVIQAMASTALLASDPMTYGMTLPAKITGIYIKAGMFAPENPRVVFCKAEFEIGGAKWTGADVKALCGQVEKSITLFKNFKPETPFSPSWGMDRAEQALKNCK
ncbi:MAG: hypothetical protein H7239_00150 [Flavobacterium sp.]|nr:hypothetical protein [Flavobacterium sp.]